VEVVLTGGRVFKSSQITSGLDTIRMFERVRADICFLGICSLHPEAGVTNIDLAESELKYAMVQAGSRVIALSTSDKMGTAEAFKVCDLTELDTIITDRLEPELVAPYQKLGIKVI
jgi:DeoR/GlpR family transcriptional regulator of sugar metabolism